VSSTTRREVTITAQTIQREPAFLRRKQVETRTGLSRSTIHQYIKDGVFPKPVPLGPRAVGWLESDVSERICRAREDRARWRSASRVTIPSMVAAGGPWPERSPPARE